MSQAIFEEIAPDNRARSIALILGAMALFSTSDAMAKLLSGSLPAVEIAWIRYVVFVVLTAAMLRRSGGRVAVRSPRLQILRGLMLVTSAITFMQSLRFMPLAEAASIGFLSPVLITLLSVPLLGEKVGLWRWIAVVLGLAGVLVVVRPGTAAFQPAALLNLASSLSWAVAVILTRKMSGANAAATLLWSSVTGFLALSLLLPFDFVRPTAGELGFGLVLGVVASSGQVLMVHAYRCGPASLLAPFSYTQLLWAVLYGALLFGSTPDLLGLVGALVIAGSGLAAARPGRA